MTIEINGFDRASIRAAIRELQKLNKGKTEEACMALAEYGAKRARTTFQFAEYDGVNDVTVVAESIPNGARVHASGNAVLFIEYGAGATRGYGHPNPRQYGPGTYPGRGHWNDPNGWYYAHGQRSWGNPPACAMYNAEVDMYYRAHEIVSGVFK